MAGTSWWDEEKAVLLALRQCQLDWEIIALSLRRRFPRQRCYSSQMCSSQHKRLIQALTQSSETPHQFIARTMDAYAFTAAWMFEHVDGASLTSAQVARMEEWNWGPTWPTGQAQTVVKQEPESPNQPFA